MTADPPEQPAENHSSTTPDVRVLRSEELFGNERVLLIEHAGQRYRLLITRNERLILQK